MRKLLAICITILGGASLGACGQSHTTATGTSASEHSPGNDLAAIRTNKVYSSASGVRGDEDRDRGHGFYDLDDRTIRDWGHPANATVRKAIAALVHRYFAAAAADDGATACALTTVLRAESLPEDWRQVVHGATTCAQVLNVVFKTDHAETTPQPKVIAVHIQGNEVNAFLSSPSLPASVTEAMLQRGAWKIERVLSGPLP